MEVNITSLLTTLGVPTLVGLIGTAYIQARQAKRPQNVLKEMLANRDAADTLTTTGEPTQEVLAGLDRLIVLEIDKQVSEREYLRKNPVTGLFQFMMFLYATVFFPVVLAMFPLLILPPNFFEEHKAATAIVYIAFVVVLIIVMLVALRWTVKRREKRQISRQRPYYNEVRLENLNYVEKRTPNEHKTEIKANAPIMTRIKQASKILKG